MKTRHFLMGRAGRPEKAIAEIDQKGATDMAKKIKVLMVDDEEQFRSTTSKILARKGYDTTIAGNGEEALEILKGGPYDVVVLDIKMPGMDGHEALARIKAIDPRIQVIMLTGHGSEASARQSLESEAFDYLSKPCDLDVLTARINAAYAVKGEGGRKEERTAGEIMIPLDDYTVIAAECTIREGIEGLKRSYTSLVSTGRIMDTGHRSIVVLDDGGELLGILSILDLLRALRPAYLTAPKPFLADSVQYSPMFWKGLFTAQVKALSEKKIAEVMSEPPPTVQEDSNLMEVVEILYDTRARRIGVQREGKVVGVIREQELFFEIAGITLGA